jgi:hypothetical protein
MGDEVAGFEHAHILRRFRADVSAAQIGSQVKRSPEWLRSSNELCIAGVATSPVGNSQLKLPPRSVAK